VPALENCLHHDHEDDTPMKAVVLRAKQDMVLAELPTPDVQPGTVRIEVKSASICGSDISRYSKGHRVYPIVLGHEVAGVISEVGPGVDSALLGRTVSVVPLVPCFTCAECRAGRFSASTRYSFIGSRVNGGFAEQLVVPAANALPVPEGLSFEQVALIEPSTVARHILDLARFESGQSAVVLGAGSIGLMVVQWLRILGAGVIIATDVVPENLAAARALGAHVALNPLECDVPAEVAALTAGGADVAIEAAGSPQALAQTIAVARPRGTVVCGGNQPADSNLPMSFIENLMRKELGLHGCFMSYSAPFPGHEWTDTVQALRDGALDIPSMISHRITLDQVPAIFADLAARRIAYRKIMISPEA